MLLVDSQPPLQYLFQDDNFLFGRNGPGMLGNTLVQVIIGDLVDLHFENVRFYIFTLKLLIYFYFILLVNHFFYIQVNVRKLG